MSLTRREFIKNSAVTATATAAAAEVADHVPVQAALVGAAALGVAGADGGVQVRGLDALTGLPEYRNGGLLLDSGVLRLKDPALASQPLKAGDELVVEWRALTVYLLDVIGGEVQKALDRKPADFPLAKVLEGGTWWAGRFLAKEKRPADGGPPLKIISDGTVF